MIQTSQERRYTGFYRRFRRLRWLFRFDVRYRCRRLREVLAARKIDVEGRRVLDFGFGAGDLLRSLPSSCHLVGADVSSSAVGAARDDDRFERFASARFVQVAEADPRDLPDERFDVIDLALTDPYRPVTSGAYSLAEDYGTTVEAFESYFNRLDHDGIFTAIRWVQTPPSEEIRLLGVAAEALRRIGADPRTSVVMLRSYSNALLLVQPDGWSTEDLEAVRGYTEALRFDIVAMPGPVSYDPNRYNVVPSESYAALAAQLLTPTRPEELYAGHEFDITPPTDDHPFFGHYFRWNQTADVLDTLGRRWAPFGGAGFLDPGPRAATAFITRDVQLLVFDRASMEHLARKQQLDASQTVLYELGASQTRSLRLALAELRRLERW